MEDGGDSCRDVDHFPSLTGPTFQAAARGFSSAWARWLPEQPPWVWVPVSGGLAADHVSPHTCPEAPQTGHAALAPSPAEPLPAGRRLPGTPGLSPPRATQLRWRRCRGPSCGRGGGGGSGAREWRAAPVLLSDSVQPGLPSAGHLLPGAHHRWAGVAGLGGREGRLPAANCSGVLTIEFPTPTTAPSRRRGAAAGGGLSAGRR